MKVEMTCTHGGIALSSADIHAHTCPHCGQVSAPAPTQFLESWTYRSLSDAEREALPKLLIALDCAGDDGFIGVRPEPAPRSWLAESFGRLKEWARPSDFGGFAHA
jgi:hypothetical protein